MIDGGGGEKERFFSHLRQIKNDDDGRLRYEKIIFSNNCQVVFSVDIRAIFFIVRELNENDTRKKAAEIDLRFGKIQSQLYVISLDLNTYI